MKARRALITGITGQDGSYMAEWLLRKGYEVYGLTRRTSIESAERLWRIQHLVDRLVLLHGDVTDQASLERALAQARPDELYNFAAQSFVQYSFEAPLSTAEATGVSALKLLEAARLICPTARIYQASTSEMFGQSGTPTQHESTPFHPRSPYAFAKVFAHQSMVAYRESYGMFICCGIAFNHESERRGLDFVTRKITHAAARIKAGLDTKLALGNLDAKRDWSYAPEIVEGAWTMLQQEQPDDYVLATGHSHSVREFLEETFRLLDLDPAEHVVIDERCMRPLDVPALCGDASKARAALGWAPRTSFAELVRIMVDADVARVSKAVEV
jgi:GDPmannose 4,6-dehydratase